ncbi:MAG: radical SAM protein [Spirochaetia bacterium]|nr:radical SAM protein [Spirochaetales bacterium]MDX9784305.1 radical SAM protein [Spirochaetia bacterium]
MRRQAEFWKPLEDGKIQCLLCPKTCVLPERGFGLCQARQNKNHRMAIPFYGLVSSLALDPVEKKPLRHFLPGSLSFSVGFWHCTMRCPFCQNWEIAHPANARSFQTEGRGRSDSGIGGMYLDPGSLIEKALDSGCPSISFTYSEPCLHTEYLLDSMELARKRGLKTILVTNGCINPEPARMLLERCDAANVDLKTDSAETYRQTLGGDMETVHNFIRTAAELCHLEVTSLLVPGILDQPEQIESIALFIASVSKTIPLHITAYHPAYRWQKPCLSRLQTEKAAKPAFGILDTIHLVLPFPY